MKQEYDFTELPVTDLKVVMHEIRTYRKVLEHLELARKYRSERYKQ